MTSETFLNGRVTLHCGDNSTALAGFADGTFDSIVCDPPYALVSIVNRFGSDNAAPAKDGIYKRSSSGFMGKKWDTGESAHSADFWSECLRVLKPGGYVLAFAGTRTYHRLACAIEDAGFEIRDMISWLYGSGFPKSHDVSKGIDRAAGAERETVGTRVSQGGRSGGNNEFSDVLNQNKRIEITAPATAPAIEWQGWGTALKPACEPICMARKPLSEGTVAANVLKWGTGAINVDGCRIGTSGGTAKENPIKDSKTVSAYGNGLNGGGCIEINAGRWPANVIHDGSEEVVAGFPETESVGHHPAKRNGASMWAGDGGGLNGNSGAEAWTDSGSAARFFYTAKADSDDRLGSKHPTVKPVDLMQYLVRLVTPKGGLVLDPFAGTGTTAEACFREGMSCTLLERESEYQADIRRRMALVMSGPDERKRESIKAKMGDVPFEAGSLFA